MRIKLSIRPELFLSPSIYKSHSRWLLLRKRLTLRTNNLTSLTLRACVLLAGIGFLGLSGCASHTGPEPSYEGCATDENWETFDSYISSGKVQTDPVKSPLWIGPAPSASTTLPASTSPVLSYQPSPSNPGNKNGDVSCAQFQPASLRHGHGTAPLHLAPISGTVFDLHFDSEGTTLYRILTTRQTATVPTVTWASWAGKKVTITIYAAQLASNEVASGLFETVVGDFLIAR